MKKFIIITLFLISSNFIYSNEADSIFISSKEYQLLNQKISQLEKDNISLVYQIEKVNTRMSDWYINFGIGTAFFVIVLSGFLAVQWNNAKGIAKEQAEKEISEYKYVFDDKIKEIEAIKFNIDILNQDAENTVKKIKNAENVAINKQNNNF